MKTKAIMLALIMLLAIPFVMAEPLADANSTIKVETQNNKEPAIVAKTQSFSNLIREKIVSPKNNTCYVYTDEPRFMASGLNTAAPITVTDVTNYKTYSFYKMHDQWTLIQMVKKNCYETYAEDIKGNQIIVYKDLGACKKTKTQINVEKISPQIQACLQVLPKFKSYGQSNIKPSGESFWVKILGLESKTYGRNDIISIGWDASGNIATLTGVGIFYATSTPGYCDENDCTITGTFTNTQNGLRDALDAEVPGASGLLDSVGVSLYKGETYSVDLSTLSYKEYALVQGETYTLKLTGTTSTGATVTQTVDFGFENPNLS